MRDKLETVIRILISTLNVNPTEFKKVFWAGPSITLSGLPIYDLGLAYQRIVTTATHKKTSSLKCMQQFGRRRRRAK